MTAVSDGGMTLDDVLNSSTIQHVHGAVDKWHADMKRYRTSKLWLQYQRIIAILRTFICSVRIGSWPLYLEALHDMHPYLAAAGHNNYTKSLALFIPRMLDLEHTHPAVYDAFMRGLFPVRRTDGAWSGIFTDLFIEQVLMAGIKSSGGLTHGRGFSESTRLLFLLSRPICADVSQSIFQLAGLSPTDGDGHRDLTAARIRRDMSDIDKLLQVFIERGPFRKTSEKLVSLSTGLTAPDSLNADDAQSVGNKILTSMIDHSVSEYKFSQKNQVKSLASALHVKTASGERIELDPQRLHQRLLVTGISDIPMHDLMKYELCSPPTCRFDSHMLMRTGDKAEHMHYLIKRVPECIIPTTPSNEAQFIIDGGALLHKFPWPKNSTYAEICRLYTQYVVNTYSDAVVVFDGYDGGASTKDETHRRRAGNDIGASVSVSADMRLTMSKKAFLANPSNKQALINLIAVDMSSAGITVEHSQGDADYMICLLACSSAKDKQLLLQMTLMCFSCWYTMRIPPMTVLSYTWLPLDRSSRLKLSRITWTIPLYDHFSSCMLLVVVIPHQGLTGLER